ncbi:hypothetical protein [Candidatus Solirubrobacter pratensis]|uniref:hypothetical protein n=1 Tax=Candidatus Solirubrobacter pratensis TaxID=1298857 RepID=UPI00041E4E6F|nr:hypothetical protein [Candidatus Solirubrobacter pratensis]
MSDERTEAERIDPSIGVGPDDPRYRGFRIREYWMATTVSSTRGEDWEGPLWITPQVAKAFGFSSPGPAMANDQRSLAVIRKWAEWMTRENAGLIIRIRHFVTEGPDEVIGQVVIEAPRRTQD